MQTDHVYLYVPATSEGLITGRDTVGIVARLQGGMKINLGAISITPFVLDPISEEDWDLLEARLDAARHRQGQIRAALEREDVLRLGENAQALRAALYRAEDLDRWPALLALRGGQPGLLKGQEVLEVCILPEPGLVRVAYRTDPIQISSILSELADLLSVQERAD